MAKKKPSEAPAPQAAVGPTTQAVDAKPEQERDTTSRASLAQSNDTPQLLTGQGTDEEEKRRREGLISGMMTQ